MDGAFVYRGCNRIELGLIDETTGLPVAEQHQMPEPRGGCHRQCQWIPDLVQRWEGLGQARDEIDMSVGLAVGEDRNEIGIFSDIGNFRRTVTGVHQNRHAADHGHREKCFDEFCP